ncbi:uncharacterized protein BDCG_06689 [Blastomyces dermatitidis ER-3]|uniref:Aminoglycoside phosphotransferase domain-containing protein n=1 Tax=Ajellomyces dermatitidis (strain ER-3 / ATCC MYA-2586) TaxID=559297 RepID=A0ABP2F6Z9_AJEDR|nr:uncharacterized protein BDCG_06689 [Blastomyces dermatitidis ER-3]EEQ91569.2 hypothetical protein BDCG_06689 [Blastomyces dermatitidis ER-3]
MDQLTHHLLDREVKKFINSIDPALVCKLATFLHPEKKLCRVFSEPKKGSYNICFPILFTNTTTTNPTPDDELTEPAEPVERWMVRIPLLPRLAFPEEKMRGEIATMKYIAERTTIPIPHLFGYSINRDNILGLPFLALEHITGKTLHGTDVPRLSDELQSHLFNQLAEIYLQLYQQQFDHIGAFTLDSNDENWIFEHNRPLTIELNDQELSGMQGSEIMPPKRTYSSTIDYVFTILKLIFNDFHRGKDSVFNEEDARNYLYGIFASQGIVMEWVKHKDNHGPFILMHGDLRPSNIFVDNDLNIVSIIDWEWSHTIPLQMFLPPSWITGQELPAATKRPYTFAFQVYVSRFEQAVMEREDTHYNPGQKIKYILPIVMRLSENLLSRNMFIAYALLKPCYFGNVYWNLLDEEYYGKDKKQRVETFFNLNLRKPQVEALQKTMSELKDFKKELALAGLEPIEPDPIPVPELGKQPENPKFMSKIRGLADIRQLCRRSDIASVIGSLPSWIPWSLAGISLSACCIMAKLRH